MKKLYLFFLLFILLINSISFAQNKTSFENTFVTLENTTKASRNSVIEAGSNVINSKLNLNSDYSFKNVTTKEISDELGEVHFKIQELYKGIKIEHAIINVHSKDEKIISFNGEYCNFLSADISPKINEIIAFKKACEFIGAEKYMWQDSNEYKALLKNENKDYSPLPKAEVVFCRNFNDLTKVDFRLAYKFDIYASLPISRNLVYVDANTGEILLKDAIIKHVDGTAQTKYSGTRNIQTTMASGVFQLRDYTRGSGIETYNMKKGIDYSLATNFTDNDNNWTSAEWNNLNKDNAALDAHFGTAKTYDYFLSKFNRNSYDNAGSVLRNYVHYSNNYFNAFWSGNSMVYGDGDNTNGYNPLTTVDIVGHELGHAVCQESAGLVYLNESGALNEGFSDIWGACVEYFTDPAKQTWLIGEDMSRVIRSMANPNSYSQPDTYLGTNWYTGSGDNGGVHYNSGVLNFWFYLLSVGGSGTNDKGTNYSVASIGIDKAAKIAYRCETVYLTPNSDYAVTREYCIRSAAELYGTDSAEFIATSNAWCAVGVGACAPSCFSNLLIDSIVTTSRNYRTSDLITASSLINNNLIVNYRSKQTILKPGFKVSGNSTGKFRAFYDPCISGGASRNISENNSYSDSESSFENLETLEKIKIFPNPNNGIFKISLNDVSEGYIQVTDMYGVTFYKSEFNNQTEFDMNMQEKPKGIYIVKVTSGEQVFTSKIIKN